VFTKKGPLLTTSGGEGATLAISGQSGSPPRRGGETRCLYWLLGEQGEAGQMGRLQLVRAYLAGWGGAQGSAP